MAFKGSAGELLARLEKVVREHLEDGWVMEPPAARLALLVREELGRWTQSVYPGSTCEQDALEPDSRRRLGLTIHSPPVTHRVEIWGLACGDDWESRVPAGEHVGHSWVVLAHLGADCPNLEAHSRKLKGSGLTSLGARSEDRLTLSVWMGASAPDGCPACLGKP
jgi:hypothetical protein